MEHFGFTSKPFSSSKEVIQGLTKKNPGYQKNRCDIDTYYPRTKDAINNCKQLIEYHRKNGQENEFANPRSDVYKIAEVLITEGDSED